MKQLETILIILVFLPIMSSYLFYYLFYFWKRNTVFAMHNSAQFSAPIYVIAVSILLKFIFQNSFIAYILIYFITMLAIILIVQRVKYDEVVLMKSVKFVLRINFLLFAIIYFGLFIYWLIFFVFMKAS